MFGYLIASLLKATFFGDFWYGLYLLLSNKIHPSLKSTRKGGLFLWYYLIAEITFFSLGYVPFEYRGPGVLIVYLTFLFCLAITFSLGNHNKQILLSESIDN